MVSIMSTCSKYPCSIEQCAGYSRYGFLGQWQDHLWVLRRTSVAPDSSWMVITKIVLQIFIEWCILAITAGPL